MSSYKLQGSTDELVALKFPDIEIWRGVDLTIPGIGAIWLATATGIPINQVLKTLIAGRLVHCSGSMSERMKIEAFDYIANHYQEIVRTSRIVEDGREKSEADALMMAVAVREVVEFGSSKEAAIAHVVREFGKAKSTFRNEKFKFLFSRTSKRQVETTWAKYEKVLHYSEFIAGKAFGSIPSFTRELDPRTYPGVALRKLRERGLVRKATIVRIA